MQLLKHGDNSGFDTDWAKIILGWGCGVVAGSQFSKIVAMKGALTSTIYTADIVSWLITAPNVTGLVCGGIIGRWCGRIGVRKVLLSSLFLAALIDVIQIGAVYNEYAMMMSRLIEGVSNVGITIAAPLYMIGASSERKTSIVMGIWGTFFGASLAIWALFASVVVLEHLIERALILHISMSVVVFIIIYFYDRGTSRERDLDTNVSARQAHMHSMSVSLLGGPIAFGGYTFIYLPIMIILPTVLMYSDIDAVGIALPIAASIGTIIAGPIMYYVTTPWKLCNALLCAIIICATMMIIIKNPITDVIVSLAVALFVGMLPSAILSIVAMTQNDHQMRARLYGVAAQCGSGGALIGLPAITSIAITGNIRLNILAWTLCIAAVCIYLTNNMRYIRK